MSCPNCKAATVRVLETRRTKDGRRRRMECRSCNHPWTLRLEPAPPTRDRRPPSQFTADQVREILQRRDLSQVAMAAQLGCAASTIHKIRNGMILRDVAPEVLRWNASKPGCQWCHHYRGPKACRMDVPDLAEEGPGFAVDCDLYDEMQQPYAGPADAAR